MLETIYIYISILTESFNPESSLFTLGLPLFYWPISYMSLRATLERPRKKAVTVGLHYFLEMTVALLSRAWHVDLLKKKRKLLQPCLRVPQSLERRRRRSNRRRIQIKTEISISHYPNLEVQQAEYQWMKEQTRETAISSGKLLGGQMIYDDQLRVWWPGRTEAVVFATRTWNGILQKHPIFRAFLFPQQKQLVRALKYAQFSQS